MKCPVFTNHDHKVQVITIVSGGTPPLLNHRRKKKKELQWQATSYSYIQKKAVSEQTKVQQRENKETNFNIKKH
jgi:hypothetical protein